MDRGDCGGVEMFPEVKMIYRMKELPDDLSSLPGDAIVILDDWDPTATDEWWDSFENSSE